MFQIPFTVKRSIEIQKSVTDVFHTLTHFETWPKWSPWLHQEPECSLVLAGIPRSVGHSQEWNGKRIGSGKMVLDRIEENKSLHYTLTFLKPWKSKSAVTFTLEEKENSTVLSWSMEGSMPFFLFFMKKQMSAWIGSDYQRGLSMLKEYLETGMVLTQTDIAGTTDRQGFFYVGISQECSLATISDAMEQDFATVYKWIEEKKLPKPDFYLSIYEKHDMVQQSCKYIAGVGYHKKPDLSTTPFVRQGRYPAHRSIQVNHIGPYRHIGNSWATAMSYQRAEKLTFKKALFPYEIYANEPQNTAEKELFTEIHIPIR